VTDQGLLALIGDYPTVVLSWVQPDGYPASVRCRVRRVASSGRVEFERLPGMASGRRGPACLLLHMHDEHLEGLRQMVLKGVLEDGTGSTGAPVFIVSAVVTANGRPDADRMPHAGAPLHMLQFYRLGRRQAQAYLRKRGTPWPPIPFDDIARAVQGGLADRGLADPPAGE
jgi:hypothetical protein